MKLTRLTALLIALWSVIAVTLVIVASPTAKRELFTKPNQVETQPTTQK